MPKTFKVWIEIEEYDEETGDGHTVVDALDFSYAAEFPTEDEARVYAERMYEMGMLLPGAKV